jgi:hypothetical protein
VENPELSRRLGESAMTRAGEFTWERNVNQPLEIYQEVTRRHLRKTEARG